MELDRRLDPVSGSQLYILHYPPACHGGDAFMKRYAACADALHNADAPFALLHDASALGGWASFDRRLIGRLILDAREIAARGYLRRAAFVIDAEHNGFWHRSISACVRRLSPVRPTLTFVDRAEAIQWCSEADGLGREQQPLAPSALFAAWQQSASQSLCCATAAISMAGGDPAHCPVARAPPVLHAALRVGIAGVI